MKSIVTCWLFAIMLTACSGVPLKLGNVTNVAQIDLNKGERIEVSAGGFQLFGFIPIGINDRHQRAYAQLQQLAGDRMITDVKVEESWKYAVIGTVFNTAIQAMVYPKPMVTVAPTASPAK